MNTRKGSIPVSNIQVLSGERSKMKVEWQAREAQPIHGSASAQRTRACANATASFLVAPYASTPGRSGNLGDRTPVGFEFRFHLVSDVVHNRMLASRNGSVWILTYCVTNQKIQTDPPPSKPKAECPTFSKTKCEKVWRPQDATLPN